LFDNDLERENLGEYNDTRMKIAELIHSFMILISEKKVEIYNEFSFQHELGIYIRNELKNKYKVQFERNVSKFNINKMDTLKKEIDIVIFNDEEKYCIELKYPKNGQYPESMYSFLKDIKFCEELAELGFDATFSLVYVEDKLFYEGLNDEGIYKYFRKNTLIQNEIRKPTGNTNEYIKFKRSYTIDWKICGNSKYYLINIPKLENKAIDNKFVNNELDNNNPTKNNKIINKRVNGITKNLSVGEITSLIQNKVENAKNEGKSELIIISGKLHNELNLSNAMPTVCNALRKVATLYPNTIITKPESVKGENSSTIKFTYRF
jgi:hypothetical protein